ncbi:MAG TPA: YqaJ viral recombinase family protein, partial [Candidatus Limnocylindrales bacterium]
MTAAQDVVQLLDREWMPLSPWKCPAGMLVCSATVDRDVWLEQRQTGIGASEVAALFGVSPWQSPWEVWALKTGRLQPPPENEAMMRGRILEDGVADLWVATLPKDKPVRLRRQGLMRHRAHSWMLATVDRLSVCQEGRCVVEIKTGTDLSDWDGDETPVAYQLQTQQQLAVTGRDHAHLVVLGPRFQLLERTIPRDDELIADMVEHLGGWWQRHVVEDLEPDATARAADALARLYGNPDPDAVIDLPTDLVDAPDRIRKLTDEAKALEAQADELRARIKQAAGNASIIRALGQTVATWKPSKRIAGVNAAWRKANPDLVAAYSREVAETVLDVDRLVEEHPHLIGDGAPLYRVRT